MGNVLEKGSLFPEVLVNEMVNLVRGKSSLARLSESAPLPFNGAKVFTFNFDHEVNLVGESAAKANGGATIQAVSMQPIKVEYGMRVSDEFRFAAEEVQLQYLQAFAEGFARKVARGIDIMAMHGVNPRTGLAASALTNKNFDDLITNLVSYNEANGNMIELVICNNDGMAEGVVASLQAAGYNIDGGHVVPVFGVDATDNAKALIADGAMTGTVKQDNVGMAQAIANTVKAVAEGTAAVEALAGLNDARFTIAADCAGKLFVAYAPYTGA